MNDEQKQIMDMTNSINEALAPVLLNQNVGIIIPSLLSATIQMAMYGNGGDQNAAIGTLIGLLSDAQLVKGEA